MGLFTMPLALPCFGTFLALLFNVFNFFVWLRITDEGSVPEMRIWSILLIYSDLKWCIYLSRSLYLNLIEKTANLFTKVFVTPKSLTKKLNTTTWIIFMNAFSLCYFYISTLLLNYCDIREKGRDLTQSYDKSPYTHRTIQKAQWQHKKKTPNFDYTTIADRLRTVSWSKKRHPLVWLNRFMRVRPSH